MAKENTEEKTVIDELEDVEVEDDFFEKVLNEDIQIPDDDDENEAGSSTSDKKTESDQQETDDTQATDEVAKLKATIAKLEKEAKGRLDDVVKSRREKATFKSELAELKGAVSALLAGREQSSKTDDDVSDKEDGLADVVDVEFGEDDKAFVDISKVKEAIAAEQSKTREEIEQLRLEREEAKAREAYAKNVQSIISENKDVFSVAYDNLKTIYKDLNESIIELQKRTGEMGNNGTLTPDIAIELFSGSPEEESFKEKYPDVDPTRIARAFNTKVDLKTTLSHIAEVNKIGKEEIENKNKDLDVKLKNAKDKPGSLSGHENRGIATSNLVERVGQLNQDDIDSLSDAEIAKIEAMLLKQELEGD